MQQHTLRSPKGAGRPRKRVGRGDGSGHGSFSGRGVKGQNSRSGGGVRLGFEGGQLPLIKKLPSMRGFTNIFRTEYQVVNVGSLADLPAGSDVTLARLADMSLIKAGKGRVKLLGRGEINVALTVEAHASSRSARSKIEAAGGSVRGLD